MKKSKVDWRFKQLNRNVFSANTQITKNKDWEAWFLLTSDQHWDNPHSNHKLQLKHLKEAKERGAGIISAGDFFCLMQGKYDKRSSKNIRQEHLSSNYLDDIIETSVEFFGPYAPHFVTIAMGNHEWAIRDRHETNMIERFCGAINHQTGSTIHNGGFSGYLVFRFDTPDHNGRNRVVLHYDHGYGGGGPVTKDVIAHYRRSVIYPDADIVISGHTHDQFVYMQARERLTSNGFVRQDEQVHIKIPSYKDARGDGFDSWEVTKGLPPKPIGAWWLRFFYDRDDDRIKFDVIKAQ